MLARDVKYIVINSKDYHSKGDKHYFNVVLNHETQNIYKYISLSKFVMSDSNYNISTQNEFTLTYLDLTNGNLATELLITIEPGQYNGYQLAAYLTDFLTVLDAANAITVTYRPIQNSLRFTATDTALKYFLTFPDGSNKLKRVLGLYQYENTYSLLGIFNTGIMNLNSNNSYLILCSIIRENYLSIIPHNTNNKFGHIIYDNDDIINSRREIRQVINDNQLVHFEIRDNFDRDRIIDIDEFFHFEICLFNL